MASSAKPGWCSRPPRVGDIVTCLYPNDPKGRLRPCLVLETRAGSEGGYAVRVAYGTTNLNKEKRANIDLIIEAGSDIQECGIAEATRFDLENTAIIPWEPPDCDCWHGRYSPRLGALPLERQIDCAHKIAAIQDKQEGD